MGYRLGMWVTGYELSTRFDDRPYFGEPLLVSFYIYFKADISGTRNDINKTSTVFFPVFPLFSY